MISPSEYSQVTRPRKVVGAAFIVFFWGLALSVCITLAPRDNFPVIPPAPPMPSPNAADVFHNAALLLHKNGGIQKLPIAPKAANLPLIRAEVQANRKAITEFRRALTLPCQYPLNRHLNDSRSLHLEEFDLTQLIEREGQLYEAEGNWRAAADSYLDIYEFGIKLAARSSFLNGLTGTVFQAVALKPLGLLLDRCDFVTATHIVERMKPLYACTPSAVDILREERFEALCQSREPGPKGHWRYSFYHIQYCQEVRMQQGNWEEILAWAKEPRFRRGPYPHSVIEKEGSEVRQLIERWTYLTMPRCQVVVQITDERQTEAQLVFVKAKLVAYRGQHGGYPASLAALVLPRELVTDPYSNKPLIYGPPSKTSKDGKMKLHSVGPNAVDNGGRNDDLLPGAP